ncbi:P-type DNA transfer protein VirB5 [Pseudomonas sp. PSPC3-3]|uniref:P-type DNA transfer protein VirB5 n=1 Tax=unclassified Pseudomonas TaxID=196821 RepID=UPI003CEB5BF8
MKSFFAVTALSVALIIGTQTANAIGIPTLDTTTAGILVVNATAQAKQALDALKQAKDGIEQAKAEYDHYTSLISGNANYGDFLNNPALNKVLPVAEWDDIYKDAKRLPELRQRYGMTSDDPYVQKAFDRLLTATGALEANYEASNERVKNAEALRQQINQVDTPQQKQDLQLRYQQELVEQQNQQIRMANMIALTEQKEKIESKKRAQDFQEHMRGKGKYRSVQEMDQAYDKDLDSQ